MLHGKFSHIKHHAILSGHAGSKHFGVLHHTGSGVVCHKGEGRKPTHLKPLKFKF